MRIKYGSMLHIPNVLSEISVELTSVRSGLKVQDPVHGENDHLLVGCTTCRVTCLSFLT
jgi:hypothetical protein